MSNAEDDSYGLENRVASLEPSLTVNTWVRTGKACSRKQKGEVY